MATRPATWARCATSAGGYSPSDAVEWQCRSTCAVGTLRRGPRRLRLVKQLHQFPLRELGERRVRAAVADGREPSEPAAPFGARPLLEHDPELIASVHRDAARRKHLPGPAVHDDPVPRHRRCYASAGAARDTSVHSSQASGAYVPRLCNRFSSLISSGRRDAWARCDISVWLSENSVNSCGSFALRNSQMRWPRASADWHSSRSVARQSGSWVGGTRTRAAVGTLGSRDRSLGEVLERR